MPLLTLDYETFYEKGKDAFSLRTMDPEAYVLDKRFQVHGCAVALDYDAPQFLTHRELVRFFEGLDWSTITLCSHNALFDASITAWKYRKIPKLYIDTMGLANSFIRPYTGSSSLDNCAKFENLPLKDGTLSEVCGLRTEEILQAPGLWGKLAEYANQDLLNCRAIFRKYYPRLSVEDRYVMDWTIRNYIYPRVRLDPLLLTKILNDIKQERMELAVEAGITDPKLLTSRAKFADYLETLGVEVEYKNGKNDAEIPAISKNDPFVLECLNHPNYNVRVAMKARLVFSSSIDISRTERLLRMAAVSNGFMLLPTVYSAAHTGRIGGTNKVNITNLRKKTAKEKEEGRSVIRDAIQPPSGHVFLECDASQAEARIIAWLSGCEAMLEAFRDPNRDFYCEVGRGIYGEEIEKKDPRRQQAKITALAAQYGLGKRTLAKRLNAIGIPATEDDADVLVQGYRGSFPEVLANGRAFIDRLIWCVQTGNSDTYKNFGLSAGVVSLPSGGQLLYDRMTYSDRQLVYWSHRYRSWQKLYAGSINENIAQALTHHLVKGTVVRFRKDTIAFTYDAVTRLIREETYDEEAAKTIASMRTTPPWAEGLPLDAEAKMKRTW